MIALSAFLPTSIALAGIAGTLFAGAVLMLCGRLLTGGRAVPELALVAGWGGYAMAMTLWGVATPAVMLWPALAVILVALAALVSPRTRIARKDARALGRVLILSLPIWIVMAAARPALPDTFTNFLPNAVYLFDHGFFPADDRARAFAVWPAFPYNAQLFTYLATLFLPEFPPAALVHFNLLLQVAAGLLFARLLEAPRGAGLGVAPSWGACAGGLLLVTALNPGFAPRIAFTSYAEPELTIGLAFLAWLAASSLERMAERRASRDELWCLALVLLALVGAKQVGIVLGGGVMLGMLALALLDRRIAAGPAVIRIIAAALPALLLYGIWRAYVLTHFVAGELKLLPAARWEFSILPNTLWHMLVTIVQRPFLFVVLGFAIAWGLRLWAREGLTLRVRLLVLTAVVWLVYNGFLVMIYVIHMGEVAGGAAHSYFRYMTHLSLLMVLALLVAGRQWWDERPAMAAAGWRRRLAPAAIILMLAAPVAFATLLRFDLDMPQPLVWTLARDIAGEVKPGDRLALVLPGDNGSVALMLRAALELTPPRRRDLDIFDASTAPDPLAEAARRGYWRAFVSCPTRGMSDVPPNGAALLAYDGTVWRVAKSWPYPPVPARQRWTSVLSAEPLCRNTAIAADG